MKNRLFGNVPNVVEGQHFHTRLELSYARVRRPPRAGISGSQTEGADSIILPGGYEDDKDFGNVILYAGHGRDRKSKKQRAHQDLLPVSNWQCAIGKRKIQAWQVFQRRQSRTT